MTGKILIKCDLVVRTGLHIGGSSSFSAIGTVDSPVIRDPCPPQLCQRRNTSGFFRRRRGAPADVRRL